MNSEIKLPSNIKQIGTIPDGFRIYMEDYVGTYITKYAREAGCEEKIAVLIGESCIIGGNEVLFISGAIPPKDEQQTDSVQTFSAESMKYINEKKSVYFGTSKIVGWLYIQPGFGERISEKQAKYHKKLFPSHNQVMLVCDPLEDVCIFYTQQRNREDTELVPAKGYIIYYDKNEGMKRFMEDNETEKTDSEEFQKKQRECDEKIRRAALKNLTAKPTDKPQKTSTNQKADQKKLVNLFGSLSAVLFLVCFVMGSELVKNDDRINRIEEQLVSVDNSYKYIVSAIKDNNVQSVFAQTSAQQIATEKATEPQTAVPTTAQPIASESIKTKKEDFYIVQKGDTLGQISRTVYGDSSMIDEIMKANDIDNPDKIQSGDRLIMP